MDQFLIEKTIDDILNSINEKYNSVFNKQLVLKNDTNWYNNMSILINIQEFENRFEIDINLIKQYVIEHIIDELLYEEYMELLEYLEIKKNIKLFVSICYLSSSFLSTRL